VIHSHGAEDEHDHSHDEQRTSGLDAIRVLAIDVGAGTQDILIYDSAKTPENCFKLVLPSQTQVVAQRIRHATAHRKNIHLTGWLMGGGASGYAVQDHLAAGLTVSATPSAARTLHNDPERVNRLGVQICDECPPNSVEIELKDVDIPLLRETLTQLGIETPEIIAVAVQDHGYRPGSGNNAVRFEYLQSLLDDGGTFGNMVFREPPSGMTRMQAVFDSVPGAYVMDTGAAAVLGALGDPAVSKAVRSTGAILVNIGNMHTFATLIKGDRLYGLFEHHTGGITADRIAELVNQLQSGASDAIRLAKNFDGHGAAVDPAYQNVGPFQFVTITGPNRDIARPLGFHEAAPHGDMMLTGSFGLVEGVLLSMKRAGADLELTLAAP
jgi:uncharacterized protein (DUF1786 family)